MAITKVIAIRSRLDSRVNYVTNSKKTHPKKAAVQKCAQAEQQNQGEGFADECAQGDPIILSADGQTDVDRGELHGRIGHGHEQYEEGQAAALFNGGHGHAHAQDNDGLGAADDGAKEEHQGKDQEGGDGQLGEELRQAVDDAGGGQNLLEDHNQQGADQQPGLKGGGKEGLELLPAEPAHHGVAQDAQENGDVDRDAEGHNEHNGEENGPEGAQQQLPVEALGLVCGKAGVLGQLAEVNQPAHGHEQGHHGQHGQGEHPHRDPSVRLIAMRMEV